MQIELWGIEFNKRKNSTKIPSTQGVVKQVTLKEHCTTMAPSFFVTGAVGYSYLKAWNNYYWITNIGFDINGHEYIDCQIDVLASWRSIIQNSTFFVERCADARYYNTDIFDDALSIEDGAEVSNTAVTSFITTGGSSFIVRVMGSGSTGISSFVFSNLGDLGDFFNPLFDNYTPSGTGVADILQDITNAIICDPSKYIYSAYYSPLPPSAYAKSSTNIQIGWYDSGNSGDKIINSSISGIITLAKPTNLYSDFRRTDRRCSIYYLHLPGVGTVELSPDIIEMNLQLVYEIDTETGGIHYNLLASGSPVAGYSGNIYAPLGLGKSTANGGSAISTIMGATEFALGMSTGSLGLTVAGGKQAISGIGGTMTPQASIVNSAGGAASLRCDYRLYITAIQKHTAEFPVTDYGRPCCKNLLLSLLTGFVKCGNASIDIAADLRIREEINEYLNTGFFME